MSKNSTLPLGAADVWARQVKKIIGAALASGFLVGSGNASALTLPYGDVIANGGFGIGDTPSLANWTTTGGTGNVNARASTNAINTGLGNSGFSPTNSPGTKFFSSAFAVLGDQSGLIQAGDAPNVGTFTLYQGFSLPDLIGKMHAGSYDISIQFTAVFDGLDSTSTTNNDVFSVSLYALNGSTNPADWTRLSLISVDSQGLRNINFSTGSNIPQKSIKDLGNGENVFDVAGLLPGDYRLVFELLEIGNTPCTPAGTCVTNTAAGVDTVSAIATANIPEPLSTALLGIGSVAMARARRRMVKVSATGR